VGRAQHRGGGFELLRFRQPTLSGKAGARQTHDLMVVRLMMARLPGLCGAPPSQLNFRGASLAWRGQHFGSTESRGKSAKDSPGRTRTPEGRSVLWQNTCQSVAIAGNLVKPDATRHKISNHPIYSAQSIRPNLFGGVRHFYREALELLRQLDERLSGNARAETASHVP
jgi:hypothetical protein